MTEQTEEGKLTARIMKIEGLDTAAGEECRLRWSHIAHPLRGLGTLETDLARIAELTGSADIKSLSLRTAVIFCSDNGVTAEGISQTGQYVTARVAENLARGKTPVCRMAETCGCRILPVDMGIAGFAGFPGVLDRRIGNGTGNILHGPAMTRDQAAAAVNTGYDIAVSLAEEGQKLLAAGEMGIGNTTTAAAVLSVLLGKDPSELAGKGAGLSDEGLKHKISVIRAAVSRAAADPEDILGVISELGGYDIAGMCGLFLGGAAARVPVLADGIISSAAALLAVRMCPEAKSTVLASHISSEPGAALILEELGTTPLISAGLHNGEGSGAVLAMPLLDMALAVYNGSSTFDEAEIEEYRPL